MKYFFIAPLFIALSACSLLNSSSENEIGLSKKQLQETAIIGDVGNKDGSLFSKNIYANSFESIAMALKSTDGAQVDIQISKDSTLWLFGEKTIRDCKFQKFKSLSEYDDGVIKFSSVCWYEKQLIPLDSFIYLMDSAGFIDKTISLNLQSINDPVAAKRFGGEEKLAELMAQKLTALNQIKGLTFLAELPTIKAIQAFEKQSDLAPYLRISENSRMEDYHRLSVPILRQKEVNRKKVKSFQLYGANTADQLLDGIKSGAQIVQTSDLEMAEFIQKSSDKESKHLAKDSLNENISDTLFSASLSEDQLKKNFMLKLSISEGVDLSGATLYIQGFNEDGDEVMWEGDRMQENKSTYWKFINSEELEEKGCKQILVYIWGQNLAIKKFAKFELRQLVR